MRPPHTRLAWPIDRLDTTCICTGTRVDICIIADTSKNNNLILSKTNPNLSKQQPNYNVITCTCNNMYMY